MAKTQTENEKPPTIVIKRIKKIAGGHHGGAWKVAYADFVTAMMAFFLLLWLLNVTTEEQKNAISNYFDPSHPKVSDVMSGAGGILGGMTMSPDGAMVSTVQPLVQPQQPVTTTHGVMQGNTAPGDAKQASPTASEQQLAAELRKKEDERFKAAAEKLKASIASSPDLKDLANNVLIDITPEGLRIQIVDDQGRSMFPSGSAVMYDFMRQLLLKVTTAVTPLPNQISVRGHTDSVKYREPLHYDNWNLSADRAQASRRVMVEGGLPEKRIENVMGRADRDHLVPAEPANPRNRRISIILLREEITQPAHPLPEPIKEMLSEQDKRATQVPAEDHKLPGIEIIDDTKPVPAIVAGAPKSQQTIPDGKTIPDDSSDATNTQEQELPPGYVPLPVTPGGTKSNNQPQSVTFGDAPAGKSDNLYQGPTQSPYVNKPPTIRTPVFKIDGDDDDDAPAASATAPAPASTAAPVAPVPAAPRTVTFGEAPSAAPFTVTHVPAANDGRASVPATPKVLSISPAIPDDMPDLQLIQPKQQPAVAPQTNAKPKVITFGDTGDNAAPAPAPAVSAPAPAPAKSGKSLTFD